MAVKSATYYWVECDECGEPYSRDDVWSSETDAIDAASDDWRIDDDRDLCDECYHKFDERSND